MKNLVLTGGGTLGHCTPHFAILPYVKNHFDNVYYIGSKNGIEKDLVLKNNLPYYSIDTTKLDRSNLFKNFSLPYNLIKSINQAKQILKNLRPSVVFSKGGFVGLPVTIASKLLKIPVIVHESDLTIGLANKIASRFADKTLFSFDKDFKIKNQMIVGPPLSDKLFKTSKLDALKYYNIKTDKPVLLVTGGSLGASVINDYIRKNIDCLTKKFTVLHITGKGNLSCLNKKDYYQKEFTEMQYAYNLCDVAISRAGANSAFELISLKKPSIFIPLPKTVSRGDQIENANYFASKNLCKVLPQENINNLASELFSLYDNRNFYINNLKNNPIKIGNKKIASLLNLY